MTSVFQDFRHALRALLRAPGFTLVVIATLSVGLGASITMFSLLRAVLWLPLPYPEPDRMVLIQVDARNVHDTGASPGELLDLKARSVSFARIATIEAMDAGLERGGETEHVRAAGVSDDLLPLLGARPALGRTPDSRNLDAVMISDALWHRRFGADERVLGQSLRVNGQDLRIAGVLAPGFRLFLAPVVDEEQIDIWFPRAPDPSRKYRGVPLIGRLRAGVTTEQANAELATLVAQFAREYPAAYTFASDPASLRKGDGRVRFTAKPLHEEMTREARPALFLLAGAVGFLLLIACVNVANLLLARGAARQRELAIRRALGADRARVIRQLLVESLTPALISAAAGLLLARFGLAAIAHLASSHIPLESRVELDATAAAVALAMAIASSVFFGLLPAWQLTAGSDDALRAGRTESSGTGARGLHRALVVAEVALSILPLAGGGLMLRSFVNLTHTPLGFNAANVVTAKAPVNFQRYPQIGQRWLWLQDVMTRVRALPGVEAVSAASPLPLAPEQERRRVGRADQPEALPLLATQQFATPGYLRDIGTPLLRGRDFTAEDITQERPVTLIDERLAKRLWPEGALGKRLSVFRTGWRNDLEVIGITAPVRMTRVRDDDVPNFLLPYSTYPEMSLVVKTRERAETLAPGIRQAADAAHGGWPAFRIVGMSAYVDASIGGTRFLLAVLAAFAIASVLLAAVGLYGTMAYLTSRRTREFGIRLALGSGSRAILTLVLREGVLLALAGTALGLAGVAGVTGALKGLLYGVRPLDAGTLAGVAVLVTLVALCAAGIPAWRAARVDPQSSLRME